MIEDRHISCWERGNGAVSRRAFLGASAVGLASVSGIGPAYAATSSATDIVQSIVDRDQLPGVGAAVILDGVAVLVAGFGKANLGFDVSITKDTLFHIGSVTKHMTALLVLRLVDENKIDLDQPIGRYVGDLPPAWQALPVRRLLNHSSGLPDYEADLAWDRPYERDAFRKSVGNKPLDFKPGDGWSYCNTAYVVLGDLIETQYGQPYADVLNATLKVAGLPHGRVDDAEAVIPNRADPYILEPSGFRQAVRMSSSVSGMADGGVLLSAQDAARWMLWLDAGAGLSQSMYDNSTAPLRFNTGRQYPYGFGWFLDQKDGQPFYYHGGSVPGFSTFIYRSPAHRVSVAVFCNRSTAGSEREIAMRLAEHFAAGSTPSSLLPIPDRHPALTLQFSDMIRNGNTGVPVTKLASELSWALASNRRNLVLPSGDDGASVKDIRLVDERHEGKTFVRRYRVTRKDSQSHISVGYTADGRIFRCTWL